MAESAAAPGVLRVSAEVPGRQEQVWAAMTDWDRQGEWILATTVRTTSKSGQEIGSTLRAVTGYGPLAVVDTMRITRWDPPYRCEVEHTGRVIKGVGVFAVEPAGAGRCRVSWEERLDLPLGRLGRVGWLAVGPLSAAGLRLSLHRFARWSQRRG